MVAIERVSNLNSNITALNNDYDFSAFQLFLTDLLGGVLFSDIEVKSEFDISGSTGDISITSGKAIIVSTRATSSPITNEKIGTIYELSATKTLTGTGTKVFIEIDQTLIDDPTLIEDTYPSTDFALGKNIAVLKRESTYPTVNSYIALREYSGSIWNDVRDFPKVNGQKVDLTDLTSDINTSGDVSAKNISASDNVNGDKVFSATGDLQQQIDEINVDLGLRYSLENQDFLTGEDLTKGDSLFLETGPTFIEALTAQSVGDDGARTRMSIRQVGSGVASGIINLAVAKVVSPSVDFSIRLETDYLGVPSGVLIDASAIATIEASACSTNFVDTEFAFAGSPSSNAHGVVLDDVEVSQTNYKGVKITLTSQIDILTIVKDSDCTATKVYLYSIAGSLLTSATFSSQTATISYVGLVSGASYYIAVGSDGSAYNSVHQTGTSTFPYSSTSLDYIAGVIGSGYSVGANTKLYLTLDGNSEDSSGSGYDGVDTDVSYVTGKFGQGASMNGDTSKIVISETSLITPVITISFWVCRTQATIGNKHHLLFGNFLGQTNDGSIEIPTSAGGFSENHLYFYWFNSGWRGIVSSSLASDLLPLNTWTLVTATRNTTAESAKIYINGALTTTTVFGSGSAGSSLPKAIGVGGDPVYSGNGFGGIFDQVIIENIEWTAQQIATHYASSPTTEDTNVHNITNITTSNTIIIPQGQPFHIVGYQGTYGSETVNSTNYYKIGMITNDTSTRGANLYNVSNWGTISSTKWAYVSSDLIEDYLLSKTDGSFSYKLPDIPRIATANYLSGGLVKYDFAGLGKSLTGLTKDADYYISDTAGALSTTAGTNGCIVAKAKATDELLLLPKTKLIDSSITVGTSPFSYKNTSGGPIQVKTTAGTVSDIKIRGITVATATSNISNLAPGDTMVITYSSKPTMVYSDL